MFSVKGSMLTNNQMYVLYLLRKSMEIIPEIPSEYCSSDEAQRIISKNGILLTVYNSMSTSDQLCFEQQYYSELKLSIQQEYEGDKILNEISSVGLKCIALKGWELKNLYPRNNMRKMADIDILINPYDYEVIKDTMQRIGFSCDVSEESSWKHDNFVKGNVTVEIHKRLTDDSKDIQAWEQNMWKTATSIKDNIYEMSFVDYMVFHFVHLRKDFLNGKIGLRRIVDTWLLHNRLEDETEIRKILKSLGMLTFYERMIRLSQVTMGEETIDDNSEIMLKHAFKYGIFGTDKAYKAGRIASMSRQSLLLGKIKSFTAAVFLPYKRMKAHFPKLKKWPILLPYYWIKRIIRVLRNTRMSDNKARLDYSGIDQSTYDEMKLFFEAGGV